LSGLLRIEGNEVWVKLIGTLMLTMRCIWYYTVELGMDSLTHRLLSELESVSGRFQYIVSSTNITAIVDYAHTLTHWKRNVLKTTNDIRTKTNN
jgi:UDP-N-acetylmuramoyl-L-alanyl-D-glutamate--2,6-diaminopimelate ligase